MVLEALALGLPVVATRHGGLPEQVLDGRTGFLVEEGDVEALAACLLRLAEHPELLAELGRQGRALVEARFDAATLTERRLAVYRELLGVPAS